MWHFFLFVFSFPDKILWFLTLKKNGFLSTLNIHWHGEYDFDWPSYHQLFVLFSFIKFGHCFGCWLILTPFLIRLKHNNWWLYKSTVMILNCLFVWLAIFCSCSHKIYDTKCPSNVSNCVWYMYICLVLFDLWSS